MKKNYLINSLTIRMDDIMKKLVILFLCLLCLCGCNSIIKEYKKDGVVIEYRLIYL